MAFERQVTCDGCGKVLYGVVKGRMFQVNHYQMDGKLLLQLMDPKTHYREHIYLTQHPAQMLSFCLTQGFPCQQSWMDQKRGAYNFRKQQRLREQAAEEHIHRLETS